MTRDPLASALLVRRGVMGPKKLERVEDIVYAGGRRRDRDDDER